MSRRHSAGLLSGLLLALWLFGPGGAQSQAPEYEAIEVVDGGAIVGLVTWAGDLPELQQLPITKNPEVCDLSGAGARPSPRLTVSEENQGVSNTVVYLADIEKGKALDVLLAAGTAEGGVGAGSEPEDRPGAMHIRTTHHPCPRAHTA